MGKGFMWHVAQILQILAAGAWAITCLIPAFTVPRATTSHDDDEAFGRRRTYLLTLWIGTAIGWFFFAAGIVIYIALVISGRRAAKKHGSSGRGCTVWISTILRAIGAIAGVALGAYYAHRRLRRIYPALALAFIFALTCVVAILFTLRRSNRGGVAAAHHGHHEKHGHRDGVLPTGHHQQPARGGWRSRF